MKTTLKNLDKTVALEIEAVIVLALNNAWEGTVGEEQTWDDKREAAHQELLRRYPDESDTQIESWLEEFSDEYCWRVNPFETKKQAQSGDAAPKMIDTLRKIVEECDYVVENGSENARRGLPGIVRRKAVEALREAGEVA